MKTQLHIYDFDGTLFRSPAKPDWWTKGWWGRVESLAPPCVPEKPGAEWWVAGAVADAHRSNADPSVYSVMMTGRPTKLGPRVHELLSGAGLHFDELHYVGAGAGGTLGAKLKMIDVLHQQLPDVKRVEMWEDRDEHLGPFESALKAKGFEAEVHHVRSTPMPLACGPEDSMSVRVAVRYALGR